ncbi:hypothetical protein H9P43_000391 [Blastocladiella emersonii ATCC 22665]|nr:hypothetical protein H9P43_000391 [Blastocladiella emersonii ATCC 22665]
MKATASNPNIGPAPAQRPRAGSSVGINIGVPAAAAAKYRAVDEGVKGHRRSPRTTRREVFRVTAGGAARVSVIVALALVTVLLVAHLHGAGRVGTTPDASLRHRRGVPEKPLSYYQTPEEQAQHENLLKVMGAHMEADATGANHQHQHHHHPPAAPVERRDVTDSYDSFYSTSTIAPWYACDPKVCKLPACQCATTAPPAGLSPSQVPQFVTFTLDDAVNSAVYDQPINAMKGIRGADGCDMKGIYFLSATWTNYHAVQTLYASGHEIACHTFTHSFPTIQEVVAMRNATEMFADVPQSKIRGFRAPYLFYSLESLTNIRALGFEYDSTMTIDNAGAKTVWPFTFDYGMPISCATGNCTGAKPTPDNPAGWRAPGLWEIPMYNLMTTDGGAWSMDPGVDGVEFAAMLRKSFNDHYKGNRAPFGIYLHSAYLMADPTRTTILHDFFAEIAPLTDVRFVTNDQLLTWLRNPVPLANMTAKCKPPAPASPTATEVCDGLDNNGNGVVDEGVTKTCQFGTSNFATCKICPIRVPSLDESVPPLAINGKLPGCQLPSGGCGYGAFNAATCMCDCKGSSDDPNGSGACRNALGVCATMRLPDPARQGFYLTCAQSANKTSSTTGTTSTTNSSSSGSFNSSKFSNNTFDPVSAAVPGVGGPSMLLTVALLLVVAVATGML